MKLAIVFAIVSVCACCGSDASAQAEAPAQVPQTIRPGPEVEQPQADYYVLTPAQIVQVNAMFARLREIIDAQNKELEDLREKTKPIGNCG